MDRRGLVCAFAIAALAMADPASPDPAPAVSAHPAVTLTPLSAYHDALAALPPLGNIAFQYSEVRSGPTRTIEEEHSVYRSGDGNERNETVAVNGTPVVPALVRLSASDVWAYDVRRFDVDESEYNVMSLGVVTVTGKRALGFSTVRTTPGDFSITGLYLDLRSRLPLRETFEVQGGGCAGSGTIDFEPVAATWLPIAVSVSCTVGSGGDTFKESIHFSGYRFPRVIPPDVFTGAP